MKATKEISVALVDDHPFIRSSIRNILQGMRFTVNIIAQDGADLIRQVEQSYKLPDVCLMDLHMPVMNGWEQYRKSGAGS